jgi:hypothetical protein
MTHKPLLSPIKQSCSVTLGLLIGLSVVAVPLPSVQAQTSPRPLEDLQTKDSSDFFNGRGNGQNSSIMNFIQNAIIGTPRSSEDFAADQQGSLDDAAAKFRQQRADLLRKQQPQTQSPSSMPNSSTGIPELEVKSGN